MNASDVAVGTLKCNGIPIPGEVLTGSNGSNLEELIFCLEKSQVSHTPWLMHVWYLMMPLACLAASQRKMTCPRRLPAPQLECSKQGQLRPQPAHDDATAPSPPLLPQLHILHTVTIKWDTLPKKDTNTGTGGWPGCKTSF